MRQIRPIIMREIFYSEIEAAISRLFNEVIFYPLVKALGATKKEILNAKEDPLVAAVRSGAIYFEDGKFKGTYTSASSARLQEIGARYNSRTKTWSFSGPLPPDVSIALAQAEDRYRVLREEIFSTLGKIKKPGTEDLPLFTKLFDKSLVRMDADYLATVKAIAIVPKLSAEQRRRIAAEWANNLDLYVKDWIEEDIAKLRRTVEVNAFQGRRAADLVKIIQENYGVSVSKAKFLARQETSLLLSKFRETRYTEIGAMTYKWSGSEDERERPDHLKLEGRIFRWDEEPPITNLKTGARNHPGEDFNCRCVAVALID